MTNAKTAQHIQQSNLGALIVLWELDLLPFGDTKRYLVSGDYGTLVHQVTFGAQLYSPWPIKADGFELASQGALPRPRFTMANVGSLLTSLMRANRDLLGAELKRIRTFDKFISTGADPDGSATLPTDTYILARKVRHTRKEVQWELAAAMDQADTELPARILSRDYCDQIYREWTGSSFDYSQATCPYAAASYFNETDQATTAPLDVCGKRLTSCRARFGQTAELPFRGFPGAARLKIR